MKLSISMTRRETVLGWVYLLLSIFVLPIVLNIANALLQNPLSLTEINLVFLGINFLAVALIFRRFLTASVKAAADRLGQVIGFSALAFVLYYACSLLLAWLVLLVKPDFSNVNDDTVIGLFDEHAGLMTISTVLLVPITEEALYRGLLFQGFQRKNRLLAYVLSTVVFAAIHITGYIGMYDLLTLGLCFVQYLPAGIMLAWAYEKADTIAAPILMHIVINLIGISASR